MTVEFDASIGGGTGADGMTFAIQNAAATGASASKLGRRGGGLGFSGISGLAVALDEYKNSANPSNNFAGITRRADLRQHRPDALDRDGEPRAETAEPAPTTSGHVRRRPLTIR